MLCCTLLAALLTGCAATRVPDERIVDSATGRTLTRAELVEALRAGDVVLLGELHDNPLHHRRRGELIAALGAASVVVAEQMTRGRSVAPDGDLLGALSAAGFDPRGWEWPLHEPLFAAVRGAGLPLSGGNLERDRVRRIAREGEAAWPADIAAALRPAPLAAAAQAALDAELLAGHCGQLPAARLPGMRAAQRARDAAMVLALVEAGGRPAVLLAGNGHVRKDHGVPQLLAALRPGTRVLSVAFLEPGAAVDPVAGDYLWFTPAVERGDPCAALRPASPG